MAESEKLGLYLLIGQPNMAGRGKVERDDQKKPDRVFSLSKENEWVLAVDPIRSRGALRARDPQHFNSRRPLRNDIVHHIAVDIR